MPLIKRDQIYTYLTNEEHLGANVARQVRSNGDHGITMVTPYTTKREEKFTASIKLANNRTKTNAESQDL
jgi:hypothetical protein